MRRRTIGIAGCLAIALSPNAQGALMIVDHLPGSFVDISGSGTSIPLTDDAEFQLATSSGNAIFPGGTVVVANNGGLGFRTPPSNDLDPINAPLPSNAAFGGGQALMGYWDDIDDKTGDVLFAILSDRTIYQWEQRPLGDAPGATVTFQIHILDDGHPDGIVAQLVYEDIEQLGAGGASATIGYQDGGAGFGDVQWSFNTPGAVANGTVLSIVVPEPCTLLLWLAATLLIRRR